MFDGAYAGQEIRYDETADPDGIYGHLGGKLQIVSGKVAIDGPFERARSRHSFLLEQIRFEDVAPHHWSESVFDRHNPEYRFR
ncbi:hypothetical protein P0D88_36195 [Paraburkholderia sp. RL18-103-BIB-C]|uniref:hypothetical protein n=1 Tax=unclassified Paraburkholderia TaxID=2615204 RepID=UPI0038BDFC48